VTWCSETWCDGCGHIIDWQTQHGQISITVNITRSPHRDEEEKHFHNFECVLVWTGRRLARAAKDTK
jgi:hypothetical protein